MSWSCYHECARILFTTFQSCLFCFKVNIYLYTYPLALRSHDGKEWDKTQNALSWYSVRLLLPCAASTTWETSFPNMKLCFSITINHRYLYIVKYNFLLLLHLGFGRLCLDSRLFCQLGLSCHTVLPLLVLHYCLGLCHLAFLGGNPICLD